MATKVVTEVCRLSYAHVFTPRAVQEGQEAKYSAAILIDKKENTATVAKIKAAIKAEQEIGWPTGKLPANLKLPLKDGDGMLDKNGVQRKETAGKWVINASCKSKPGIVNAAREDIIDKDEIYSGCFCRFSLAFAPYNLPTSKGVGCYLNNIQKIKDGPSLEGRESAKDAFNDGFEAPANDSDF